MSFVQERAAAVLDYCRHARTMSEIRQHFYERPDQARYAVQNLVKSNHLINLLPGARRGLYLTVSKPPVQRARPKPVKAAPARKVIPTSVFTWRPM